MTISCGEFRLRACPEDTQRNLRRRERIIAHRIHFPGAAIQSTFTSLTLGSICVAARRLITRHEPRGADVTIRHFEGGFR